jgi:hypothetical protein
MSATQFEQMIIKELGAIHVIDGLALLLLFALLVTLCFAAYQLTKISSLLEMGNQDALRNDLSAALRGKRVHLKIGGESGWTDFYPDGTYYHGKGDDRLSEKAQWTVSGNRVNLFARTGDDYMAFTDLTARPGSEVIFLNSAALFASKATKGSIIRVEPIPSLPDTLDATPPEDE